MYCVSINTKVMSEEIIRKLKEENNTHIQKQVMFYPSNTCHFCFSNYVPMFRNMYNLSFYRPSWKRQSEN